MTDKRDRYQIDATKDTRSRINALKAQLNLKTQNDVLIMLLNIYEAVRRDRETPASNWGD